MAIVVKNAYENFEQLVEALFAAEGFSVEPASMPYPAITAEGRPRFANPDFIVRSLGIAAVVEVKLYRSRVAPVPALTQVATILETLIDDHKFHRAVIITGSQVLPSVKRELAEQFPRIIVYDIDNIAYLVGRHRHLAPMLDNILRDSLTFSDFRQPEPIQTKLKDDLEARAEKKAPQELHPQVRLDQGETLCKEIDSIPPGRANARAFEDRVSDALKYLFDKDLTAWAKQKATDAGVSIYDVVARISSSHDFWTSIGHHFQSRYVVFESKNYGNKIKQGQIYTTEKYLYRAALRAIAFVISRKGPDKNALAAARGALREHGKLIINLTVDDLCEMLRRKDAGDDHNAILVDLVDEMLVRIER